MNCLEGVSKAGIGQTNTGQQEIIKESFAFRIFPKGPLESPYAKPDSLFSWHFG